LIDFPVLVLTLWR